MLIWPSEFGFCLTSPKWELWQVRLYPEGHCTCDKWGELLMRISVGWKFVMFMSDDAIALLLWILYGRWCVPCFDSHAAPYMSPHTPSLEWTLPEINVYLNGMSTLYPHWQWMTSKVPHSRPVLTAGKLPSTSRWGKLHQICPPMRWSCVLLVD